MSIPPRPPWHVELEQELSAEQAMGLCAYGEARGEPVEGIAAIIAVIRNRVAAGKWGDTPQQIVFARHQFSCFSPIDPNAERLRTIGDRLLRGLPLPDDIALRTCLWLAEQSFPDVVGGACHYLAPKMLTTLPSWTRPPARKTVEIGGHCFYLVP